jgi:hypothetical protein
MHYQRERTHGCRISDAWTYRGLKTVIIENELVRVTVLADKGADISSFVHKPSDTDFMWRTPWGVRDPSKFVPTTGHPGSLWLDQYEGGWQTVVPHGGFQDTVYGAEMGLHAELNTVPWDCQVVEDTPARVSVRFRARGARMPFAAEKTLTLTAGSATLTLDESVTNEAEEPCEAVWLEHIAIGGPFLSDRCRLYLPPCKVINHPVDVAPTSKLKHGFEGPWPNSVLKTGRKIDLSRIPPKTDRSLDMAYFTDMKGGWYALTNEQTGVGFAVTFPSSVFKYLWYWRNLGGGWGYPWYGRCYNVGLEPCTSFHNGGLKQAMENGTALKFKAGETVSATITATAYGNTAAVKSITPAGRISFA